jgi:hypothetical protein
MKDQQHDSLDGKRRRRREGRNRPQPRDFAQRRMVRTETGGVIYVDPVFPNPDDEDWMTQNFAELADQCAETDLQEERILANGSAPHQAINNQGEKFIAKARKAIRARLRVADETAVAAPLEADEHRRRAATQLDRVPDHERDRDEAKQEHGALAARHDALPPTGRGGQRNWIEISLANLALIGGDTVVFVISFTLTPGSVTLHWVTAGLVSCGLAIFANGLGWAGAALWPILSLRTKKRVAAATLLSLVGLLLWLVMAVQDFRGAAFVALSAEEVEAQDPTFFAPLQLLLAAGAALMAFRFYRGDEGRALLARMQALTARVRAAEAAIIAAYAGAEQQLQAAAQAVIKGQRAAASQPHIEAEGAAEVERLRAHARFVRWLFDAIYIWRGHLAPEPEMTEMEEAPMNPLQAAAYALFTLGGLNLAVATVALTLHNSLVAVIAVVASCLCAGLAVYLHRRLARESDAVGVDEVIAAANGKPTNEVVA